MLSGEVPEGLSSLLGLRYLNLSFNSFSGHISPTFGFLKSLDVLSLSNNHISGSVPPELGNCSSLGVIDLHSNSLSGQIPVDLSRLSRLRVLDLGRNNLTGPIPEELSNCSSLASLSLDSNHLTGKIPATLSSISSLVSLNVSDNNLEGEIPIVLGSRFNNQSSFIGNQGLCGKPLDRKCEEIGNENRRNRLILFIAVSASGILLMLSCCCFYTYSFLRWREKVQKSTAGEKKQSPARASSRTSGGRGSSENGGPKLIMFNNKITLAETIEATRQFDEENVLSRTRHGVVFKACYNDGMVLAILRLPNGSLDLNTFRKEAESLGRVKHRNLTVLRGYYAGPPDLRLLVYDYMPNGNLATLLQEASHQDGHILNWPMRHLIALGIARGLAFLHAASMVHGDVKPQNVLFDADFEAHLSDFGLDKLTVAAPAEPSTSRSVGTLGYISPEATLTHEVTRESDVYSFGIVLLELLTGKKPVMFTQDEDIVKWVKRQLQRGQISELLEPGLLELDPESSEWEEFLLGIKVGLLCTAPDPLDRPTMADIVFMLEGCRVGPDIPSSADPTSQPSPA
ncbi:UNVERIFIED_CONTAM: putative LRR receptor-like serine/threonine-protein kinase [Sesamum calycinum]|uniref:LRR receptor-like serine/threonine-protein kinase n=1 Tax=Sesamum calycinum TaxID=2727403 RepID=A0AAW2MM90_9LAMI